MDDLRRLPDEQVIQLVTKLRSLEWSWDESDIDRIVSDLGWTAEARYRRGVQLDVGFGTATGDVEFTKEGRVTRILASVCPYIDDESPGDRSWLQDVFADVVNAAITALGEPTDRLPGESPEVRWRGAQTTVGVQRSSVLVKIFLATNEYMDDRDWAVSRGL